VSRKECLKNEHS